MTSGTTDMIEIRRGRSGDTRDLVEMGLDAFPGFRSDFRAYFTRAIDDAACELWVVTRNERACAFALMLLDETAWAETRTGMTRSTIQRLLPVLVRPSRLFRTLRARRSKHTELFTDQTEAPAGARLWLELLVVGPRARRLGIGRRLVDLLEERAVEHDRCSVQMEVGSQNHGAAALYARTGFGRCSERVTGQMRLFKPVDRALSPASASPVASGANA